MSLKKDIALFLILAAILAAVATFVNIKNRKTVSISWNVMGTVATISGDKTEEVKKAASEAKELFSEYNRLLSSWDAKSELSKISLNAGNGITFEISSAVTNVYKIAFDIMNESKGAFNPLIGNVMKLWGFNGTDFPYRVPPKEEIASLPFSPKDIFFNCPKIRLEKKGMALDLGGVAKGEAIDALAAKLQTLLSAANLMIDLGGNIKTLGFKTRRIGIRNPFGEGYVGTVTLTNGEAIATSGDYERFIEIDGVRYAHIFDGRTGCPATNNVASTTVITSSAALADALSTTLYVLGPAKGTEFINTFHPDAAVLWISTSNIWTVSPSMAKRIEKVNSRQ